MTKSPSEGQADRYHPWSTSIDAREVAKSRGDRKVGTEHVLVALLEDPAVAAALGSDAAAARAALAALDREALGAVGLETIPDVPALPTVARERRPSRPTLKHVFQGRLPLTPAAKAVLRAGRQDLKAPHDRPIGPRHMVAAMLELQPPDPAAELLHRLGIDPGAARERLAAA